ncbi:unnamed protein product [Dimorphilus gyrociliatus]|uniref:Uncharacterized protein n=1 Tax=Dimorphilus gyrociliatus TaxID=2664684 RepID=A0A7I8VGF2_9ANNE|nr:unnamed protein product [Dimorphilus gyrociliatus]
MIYSKLDTFKVILIVLVVINFTEQCTDCSNTTATTTVKDTSKGSSSFEFKFYFIPIPIVLLGAGISGLFCCARCRNEKYGENKTPDDYTMERYNGPDRKNNKYSIHDVKRKQKPPVPPPLTTTRTSDYETVYETINENQQEINSVSGYLSLESSTYLYPSNSYDRLQATGDIDKEKKTNENSDSIRDASGIRSFAEVTLSKPLSTKQHNFSDSNSYKN